MSLFKENSVYEEIEGHSFRTEADPGETGVPVAGKMTALLQTGVKVLSIASLDFACLQVLQKKPEDPQLSMVSGLL